MASNRQKYTGDITMIQATGFLDIDDFMSIKTFEVFFKLVVGSTMIVGLKYSDSVWTMPIVALVTYSSCYLSLNLFLLLIKHQLAPADFKKSY